MPTLIGYLLLLVRVYYWILIIRVLSSWLPAPSNPTVRSLYRFLYSITEPYLGMFRRFLPSVGRGGMGFDFSPILAVVVLYLVETLLRRLA